MLILDRLFAWLALGGEVCPCQLLGTCPATLGALPAARHMRCPPTALPSAPHAASWPTTAPNWRPPASTGRALPSRRTRLPACCERAEKCGAAAGTGVSKSAGEHGYILVAHPCIDATQGHSIIGTQGHSNMQPSLLQHR